MPFIQSPKLIRFLNAFVTVQQRRRYLLILALGLGYSINIGFFYYFAQYVLAIGGTAQKAGVLLTALMLPTLLLATLGGRFLARTPPFVLIALGVAAGACGRFGMAWTDQWTWALLGWCVINGLSYALAFSTLLRIATEVAPPAHRTEAVSYYTLVIQLGHVLGSFFGTYLLAWGSYELLFGLSGFFLLALLPILGWIGLRQELSVLPMPEQRQGGAGTAALPREIWLALLMIVAIGAANGVPMQFMPVHLRVTPATANIPVPYFLTAATLAIVATRFGFARLMDGAHQRIWFRRFLITLGLSLLVLPFMRERWSLMAVAIAYGASYSLLYPSIMAAAMHATPPELRGKFSAWAALALEMGLRGLSIPFTLLVIDNRYWPMFAALALLLLLVGSAYQRQQYRKGDAHAPPDH